MGTPRQYPMSALRTTGLLWLINRCVFHPRGFALSLNYDHRDQLVGWSIQGNGREPWRTSAETDDEFFQTVEATLGIARASND